MHYKFLSMFAALLLLGACATEPENTQETTSEGEIMTEQVEETVTTTEIAGPVAGSQEDLAVEVGDRVFFAFDSSELDNEARDTVQKLAAWMQANPAVTVTVEGYCDERGTREYNLALGERRANAARDYLVALGVNPSRLSTISYGKERPAVMGSNEYAWAQNRRDFFKVN